MAETMTGADAGLTPLDLACGIVQGLDSSVPSLPDAPAGLTTRVAIEDMLRRALERGPCAVSFSGGRDSSALLALAVHVARREGLEPPVAMTMQYPSCEDTEETEWQELVLRRIGVEDWIRLPFDDEMDIIGPYARDVLRRHGLIWPPNAFSLLALAEQVRGGTVVTGVGGDELLTQEPLCARVNQVIGRNVRPEPRDLLRLAALCGPRWVRLAATRRRLTCIPPRPWLRPAALREVMAQERRSEADKPLRWDEAIDHGWWRNRYRTSVQATMGKVGAMHDVWVCNPFAEESILSAIAREGGRVGFPTRTEAMRHLVADLLPEKTLTRTSKATFNSACWNRYSISFAAEWDGTGVDSELVDVDVLRRIWQDPATSDGRTFTLLQAAWLSANPDSAGDPVQ